MAASGPDLRWASKVQAPAALCLAGAIVGVGLYFGNLAYIRATYNAAPAHVAPPYATGRTTGRAIRTPCLTLRSLPSGESTSIGCIPNNTDIPIECTTRGTAVTGPYGTEILWDRTIYDAATGYVPDTWVYTGTNNAAAPAC
jgi:hypothetical protein